MSTAKSSPDRDRARDRTRARGARAAPTVLLASCDPDTAELFEWALRASGVDVVRTWGPAIPASVHPDLVILHVRWISREARAALPAVPRGVPVILLTGWAPADATARDFGCDQLLLLPVLPATLVASVADTLGIALPDDVRN